MQLPKQQTWLNKKHILTTLLWGVLVGTALPSQASLTRLSDEQLASKEGQAGILVDVDMQLNRGRDSNDVINADITCTNSSTDCDVGIALDGIKANKVLNTAIADTSVGKQQWLVIHNLSGGINVTNLKIEASTVGSRPAIAIGDASGSDATAAKITFDDFGFSSLRLDTDYMDGSTEKAGYRFQPTTPTTGLDAGRPPGLTGLRINGGATMKGAIKVFNCTGIGNC